MSVPAEAERRALAIAGSKGSAEFTIAIHPGAKEPTRRWPAASYAALVERILKHGGTRILVLGEAAERAAYGQLFASFDPARVVDCVGRTSLLEVAALIRSADLFIGNDSSLLHVAIALRTPSLALFGPTSAKQLLPADPHFQSVDSCRWLREEGRALPCYMHQPIFIRPPCADRPCITTLTVEEAWCAVGRFLPPRPA
jgi:ADP-heptose:LPS heptosyltransferase